MTEVETTKMVDDSSVEKGLVIVGIDASPQSEEAFDWYLDNLHREENDLLLYHVIEPPFVSSQLMYMNGDMYTQMLQMEKDKVKELEEKYVTKMKERKTSGKIKAVFHSRPGEAMCEAAKQEKARMIVTGTRGLGTVRRTVMGSVSDFILHHAHCPVVICKGLHDHHNHHDQHHQHKHVDDH